MFCKGIGRGGGWGGVALEILSSCYYVYKQLPQKDVQILEKQERKKNSFQVISCVTHTKNTNLALVACNKLDLDAKPPHF